MIILKYFYRLTEFESKIDDDNNNNNRLASPSSRPDFVKKTTTELVSSLTSLFQQIIEWN